MPLKRGLALGLALPLEEMKAEAAERGEPPVTMGYCVAPLTAVDADDDSPSTLTQPAPATAVDPAEVTIGLIRQHLHHELGKEHPVVVAYEAAFPRHEGTITKKSMMVNGLGIVNPSSSKSVLANLVQQTMAPADHYPTAPARGGDAAGEAPPDLGSCAKSNVASFAFADDGSSLDVNGLRISEVSSIPFSVVGRLDDLDLENADVLGKGAGGRVLRATHKVHGTQHAVKEIIIGSDEVMTQVKAEISVLWGNGKSNRGGGLSPFVMGCHGVFFSCGTLYIAMECMEGSLKDALDRRGSPFSEQLLRAITFQALKGLSYLHAEKKQIHRDIKPHNILYNSEGVVKISDFGIASDKVETLQLFRGTFCGTLIYMSPARAEGLNYSFETDMWALGVSLLQLALKKFSIASSIFGVAALKIRPPRLPEAADDGTPFSPEFRAFVAECCCADESATKSSTELLKHPWLAGMTVDASKKTIKSEMVTESFSEGNKHLMESLDTALGI